MRSTAEQSGSGTDGGSSACRSERRTPESPHSHSSSALCTDEVTFPSFPTPTPHLGSALGASKRRERRCTVAPLTLPRAPSLDLGQPVASRLSEPTLRQEHERSLAKFPTRGSCSNAFALSSTIPFEDDRKGTGSDSEAGDNQSGTWHGSMPTSEHDEPSHRSGGRQCGHDARKRKAGPKLTQTDEHSHSAGSVGGEDVGPQGVATPLTPRESSDRGHVDFSAEEATVKVDEHAAGETAPELGHDCARSARKKQGGTGRQRTSQYMGVGSSNRKNQWQARILVHGKVTHLGYYETEEAAAHIYDRVAVSLNGPSTPTNFPMAASERTGEFRNMAREELQRALGVKPMDKSSRFRGVSRKKGKWEAKVMVNRKWAYRALFDSEAEAAKAYDAAVWRLKPREAVSFVNFKDGVVHRFGKRSSRHAGSLQRSKSQRLDSQSSAGSLPPAHVQPLPLTLEDLDDQESPRTPTRRHSVQLPVSCSPAASVAAALARQSSVAADTCINLPSYGSLPLQQEDLPALARQSSLNASLCLDASPEHSAFSRRSSHGQLQAPGMPMVVLPDPNSIGVPPPSKKLPFPDLVNAPSSAANEQTESGEAGQIAAGAAAGQTGAVATAGVIQAGPGLPEIPPPLLPDEASRLGMNNYFSSTPLSHGLGQAMSAGAQHAQDYASGHPDQAQPNPFLEASNALSPITPESSELLVRVGSEAHLLQDRQPGLQKLHSMGAPLDYYPPASPRVAAAHAGRTHGAAISRAASESLLRILPGTPVMDAGPPPGMQFDDFTAYGHMAPSGPLSQQHSLAASSLGGHSAVLPPPQLQSSSRQGSCPVGCVIPLHTGQPPRSAFEYGQPAATYESPSNALSHLDSGTTFHPSDLRSCRTADPELLGELIGDAHSLARSLSTSSMAPGHHLLHFAGHQMQGACSPSGAQHRAHSAQLFGAGQPSMGALGLPPLPGGHSRRPSMLDPIAIQSSEAELLAEFGGEGDIPECNSPLQLHDMQIGGDDLSLFKEAALPPF